MADELGIHRFGIVLNKSTNLEEDSRWIASEFGAERLLGAIPMDARIAQADPQGRSLVDLGHEELLVPFHTLKNTLQSLCMEKESTL